MCCLLSYAFLPGLRGQLPPAFLAGANPAVVAVAVATTTVAPDYRIFPMINGGIPLWIPTLVYLLINFSGIPYGDFGAYMAKRSRAACGFLFLSPLRTCHDVSIWMN